MDEFQLTGRVQTHVVELAAPPCMLHRAVVQPFLEMRAAALAEGIDLTPVSSFRDFAAQARIWDEKFLGRRTLYDRSGHPLDYAALTPTQILEAILQWSALPGASRHHWGTDIDVIDRAALPAGQTARLLPEEYGPDGPFAQLTAWLDANMRRFGFFRPYETDRGGVAPEPWHLSYAPVAQVAMAGLSEEVLSRALMDSGIAGMEWVVERLPMIYRRYVVNVNSA